MSKAKDNKELMRAVKFTLFSMSAGLIQILTTEVVLALITDWDYWVRYLIGLVLSVIWNFTFNRKFTFKSANNVPIAMLKVFAFYVVFTPLSTLLANFLQADLGWPELICQLLIMLLNFVTEFLYQKYFVFRGTIDTNDIAQKEAA
ncbi:MAG: GtrA family protein, partial [Lachnospiraceae bacterium]|nr:GtrA family protein [Candidatus Minthocola equi]